MKIAQTSAILDIEQGLCGPKDFTTYKLSAPITQLWYKLGSLY